MARWLTMRRIAVALVTGLLIALYLASFDGSLADEPAALDVPTVTATATETATDTATATATETPTASPTETETPTATDTAAATSTSTPSATPTATATSTPTATATATPSPTATSTPGPRYTVKIKAVDQSNAAIAGTCFTVRKDAGGGVLGSRVANVCDQQGTGVIAVKLYAGGYILIETKRPLAVGTIANKAFTVSGNRSLTVKHQPLTPLAVTALDASDGSPARDACFTIVPIAPTGPLPDTGPRCDGADGTRDGVTTFPGVDRGSYTLKETQTPYGFLAAADQPLTVTTLSTTATASVPHERTARLLIHLRDRDGNALAGGCFDLRVDNGGQAGDLVTHRCDVDDGVLDGGTYLAAPASDSYALRQTDTPTGFLTPDDQTVTLTAGETAEFPLVDPRGGIVVLQAVDDKEQPIADLCLDLYGDAGGGTRGAKVTLPPCQHGDSATDGETTLIGIPPGNYLLGQGAAATGYLPSLDIPITVAADQTQTVEVVNPVAGSLTIVTRNANTLEQAVPGSCFAAYADAGGGTRGSQIAYHCDNDDGANDGSVHLTGFTTGRYIVVHLHPPGSYNAAADWTVDVTQGQSQTLEISAEPFGVARIAKRTPADAALAGACFVAVWAPGTPAEGLLASSVVCDNKDGSNDGAIGIALPNGSFLLRETKAPAGYVRAADTPVTIAHGQDAAVTIADPTPSSVALAFVDVWNDPVPGFCVELLGGNPGSLGPTSACDQDDGVTDGTVHIGGLMWGTWRVFVDNPGNYRVPETSFALGQLEDKSIQILVTQPAPKITLGPLAVNDTPTTLTIYWETDQKTTSTFAYGMTDELGSTAAVANEPAKQHRLRLTGLTPATVYAYQVTATNPNGEVAGLIQHASTRDASASSRIVVTTTNTAGTLLPGACYSVYTDAGSGTPGALVNAACDGYELDGANGKTTVTGLTLGGYVLIQSVAPPGYKVAAPLAFTVDSDAQTVRKTVKPVHGGATVRVTTAAADGSAIGFGACYRIYTDAGGQLGNFVTAACDGLDGLDGVTVFSGIAPGAYVLWEAAAPDGYLRADATAFALARGQTSLALTVRNWPLAGASNVVVRSVVSSMLIPGACYGLYRVNGSGGLQSLVAGRCDADDGSSDGVTYFMSVAAGSYALLEVSAPPGYVAGKKTAITKASTLLTKRIGQTLGGRTVVVTTLKGSTSTKLTGACYGLYRKTGSSYELMTFACDGDDGALDGVTRLPGIAAGSYRLYQTSTPSGYQQPSYVTVTVTADAGTKLSVRTYPG